MLLLIYLVASAAAAEPVSPDPTTVALDQAYQAMKAAQAAETPAGKREALAALVQPVRAAHEKRGQKRQPPPSDVHQPFVERALSAALSPVLRARVDDVSRALAVEADPDSTEPKPIIEPGDVPGEVTFKGPRRAGSGNTSRRSPSGRGRSE
jgi:hypothetical protein